jgi:hypothetical protein
MNPPNQLTIAPTPRTDSLQAPAPYGNYFSASASDFRDLARTLERELAEATAEASHYMAVAQKATDELIFFRADNLKAHQMTCAAGLERDSLRAEVERWQGTAAKMSQEREHNANEASRLRAEVERLTPYVSKAILTHGGTMLCSPQVGVAFNEQQARAERAEAELADWSVLNLWGGTPEIVHEFIKGQQTRIHHCQDLEAELITERARLDYLALHMGTRMVAEALNCDYSKCFPIRDAIDAAMKNETTTP